MSVGSGVGTKVGTGDGSDVGIRVGTGVGISDGTGDGSGVGIRVGTGVGKRLGYSRMSSAVAVTIRRKHEQ